MPTLDETLEPLAIKCTPAVMQLARMNAPETEQLIWSKLA